MDPTQKLAHTTPQPTLLPYSPNLTKPTNQPTTKTQTNTNKQTTNTQQQTTKQQTTKQNKQNKTKQNKINKKQTEKLRNCCFVVDSYNGGDATKVDVEVEAAKFEEEDDEGNCAAVMIVYLASNIQ